MSNNAIIAENVSKRYRIGLKEKIHDSLSGAIVSWLKSPLSNYRRLRNLSKFEENGQAEDIIWALRDVSFEVKEGEVLGIIGKNGAGKSTLLKILSRITDPTTGKISIKGKVSSLLEVGTGFHPELTGRENVYLNGTIIGMSKKEIDRKFDEIVDFSGIEKFIDTPIKRYSTGMSVRLAFAVAAHIEPEVLIIDEVLAVGDAEFQKKCLGKMEGVAKEGRTVLFVSHNMMTVSRLCHNAIWLVNGKIKSSGVTQEIIEKYLSHGTTDTAEWINNDIPSNDQEVFIRSMRILTKDGEPASIFNFGEQFKIEIAYDVRKIVNNLSLCYQLYNSDGVQVFESRDTDVPKNENVVRNVGKYKSICYLSDNILMPGRYTLYVSAFVEKVKLIHRCPNVLMFDVTSVEEQGYSLKPWRRGIISPVFDWNILEIND
jgi:lipopolysaccharide transport system ATP-binding protein